MTSGPSLAGALRLDQHELGRLEGGTGGALVIAVGGLHGNEPSGVRALHRLLARLGPHAEMLQGEFVAFAGNLEALREGERFIERDLNRGWTAGRAAGLPDGAETPEDRAQQALLRAIVPRLRGFDGPRYVIDLHTTSSDSAPFVTTGLDASVEKFARRLGMPIVRGIEEQLDGAMLTYLHGFGPLGFGVEAGRHDDPAAVELHEAALGLTLVEAGVVPEGSGLVDADECRRRIGIARAGLPDVYEVVYRRGIAPEDGFKMAPGHHNFEPVQRGQVIASDARGEVRAPLDGLLFLPLYQRLGDDGFFVIRPVDS